MLVACGAGAFWAGRAIGARCRPLLFAGRCCNERATKSTSDACSDLGRMLALLQTCHIGVAPVEIIGALCFVERLRGDRARRNSWLARCRAALKALAACRCGGCAGRLRERRRLGRRPRRDAAGVGPDLRHDPPGARPARSARYAGQGRGGEPGQEAVAQATKADVDRYNALLNQYLGARCHV